MDYLEQVLVFRTNIQMDSDKGALNSAFDSLLHLSRWTVDHEDVDHVLRVVGNRIHAGTIISMVEGAGFECSELPD